MLGRVKNHHFRDLDNFFFLPQFLSPSFISSLTCFFPSLLLRSQFGPWLTHELQSSVPLGSPLISKHLFVVFSLSLCLGPRSNPALLVSRSSSHTLETFRFWIQIHPLNKLSLVPLEVYMNSYSPFPPVNIPFNFQGLPQYSSPQVYPNVIPSTHLDKFFITRVPGLHPSTPSSIQILNVCFVIF